ncbi:hypothetical protein [Mycolicibacterium tusciae]|uniref:Uncharacterized protein n=1 Tax=Mycolicibacterium tusciae TaxID=75922 RepID=A0A1X0JK19_9MYCO|nr:hypothetical protein [Mycolicibacterium tusciae]ORB62895.1 hypothetical protein BST47_21375 [Mycolicibacterium tusciae]
MIRLLGVLAAAVVTVSACGTSTPELPPDSPSEMLNVLTSDRGDDVFNNVTTYEWDDDGAAAGARFTWIGEDDGAANQGAATMVEYLISNHGELSALDSGFLGLTKVPAAQLNPQLIRDYATALAPHLGQLVGGRQGAFDSLRTQMADDPLALRTLLSVFVADPEAGRTAVAATHAAAEQYEEAAAAAPPDSDESVAALRAAGSLLGAAYGAVALADSDIPTPSSGRATSEMAVRVATILVPADPNAAIVSKYVEDGRLMSPAAVENKFSDTAMRTYYLDLQNYIGTKGFEDGNNAFSAAFKDSSGVPLS